MNELPKDPVILLSLVNTELRDRFPTLKRFCKAHGVTEKEIIEKLRTIDYTYDPEFNQFE